MTESNTKPYIPEVDVEPWEMPTGDIDVPDDIEVPEGYGDTPPEHADHSVIDAEESSEA